jgi:hypothetical protein
VGRPGHARRLGTLVGVDAGVQALAVLSAPVPGLTDGQGRAAKASTRSSWKTSTWPA